MFVGPAAVRSRFRVGALSTAVGITRQVLHDVQLVGVDVPSLVAHSLHDTLDESECGPGRRPTFIGGGGDEKNLHCGRFSLSAERARADGDDLARSALVKPVL